MNPVRELILRAAVKIPPVRESVLGAAVQVGREVDLVPGGKGVDMER